MELSLRILCAQCGTHKSVQSKGATPPLIIPDQGWWPFPRTRSRLVTTFFFHKGPKLSVGGGKSSKLPSFSALRKQHSHWRDFWQATTDLAGYWPSFAHLASTTKSLCMVPPIPLWHLARSPTPVGGCLPSAPPPWSTNTTGDSQVELHWLSLLQEVVHCQGGGTTTAKRQHMQPLGLGRGVKSG